MPEMTAVDVARTWKEWGRRCHRFSVPSTIPSSARMNCQASVRITNETKNGNSSRKRNVVLCRPPRNAIQYASGNATTSVTAVAMDPYTSDRTNWTWYCWITSQYWEKCQVMEKPLSSDPV